VKQEVKRRDKLPVTWAGRLETEVKVLTQRSHKEKKAEHRATSVWLWQRNRDEQQIGDETKR